MVLIMMMVAAVTFADAKSDATASMEETRVERNEDFDAWFKKVNAELKARDAELKARDAELKAAIEEIIQYDKELRAKVRKAAEAKENK